MGGAALHLSIVNIAYDMNNPSTCLVIQNYSVPTMNYSAAAVKLIGKVCLQQG